MKATTETLVKNFRKNGGFSYNPTTHDLNPTEGWMVSIEGFELKLDLADMSDEELGMNIEAYMKREDVSKALNSGHEEMYLGAWENEGHIYLDLSVKFDDVLDAHDVALINNQKAIYDCQNSQSVNV